MEAVDLDHLRPARRLHVGERGVEHLRLVRKERDPRQVRAYIYIFQFQFVYSQPIRIELYIHMKERDPRQVRAYIYICRYKYMYVHVYMSC